MLYLTRQEKKSRLIRRLGEKFGVSSLQYFDLPRSLLQYGGNVTDDGIHVFVDSSNIAIGFSDALKLARGLPIHAYTKRAPIVISLTCFNNGTWSRCSKESSCRIVRSGWRAS